jgi:predicted MFS family arabinose efflux permease
VISGLLTDFASWRWIFYINLPVAVLVLLLVPRMVTESRMVRDRDHRLDIAGAGTLTGGLFGVVYGLLAAADHPWASVRVLLPIGVGAALLVAMAVIERRAQHPLIPLAFFANRTRSVINIATLCFTASFLSYTFMLTLFEQHVLGYSPLRCGLSWLPLGVAIGIGIGVGTALSPRLGVRLTCVTGFVGAAIGLVLLSTIDVHTSYPGGILPGMVVFGLFAGLSMPASTSAALHRVTGQDSGLASGVQATMQQVGSALGLAVLVTLALRHADARSGVPTDVAVTSGYVVAFRVGAALLVLGAVLIAALFERVGADR